MFDLKGNSLQQEICTAGLGQSVYNILVLGVP
jgi:hypothetical protein